MTQFQKLIYSIAHNINDDNFVPYIRILCKNGIVDKQSLLDKLQQIHNNRRVPDNARDFFTEIKASIELSKIRGVNKLIYNERPDLLLGLNTFTLAIEVKRFRFRSDDESDDINLREVEGDLKVYGDSLNDKNENLQEQVENAVKVKINSYEGTEPFYLYFWSDSIHQVEDSEIKTAVRYLRNNPPDNFNKIKGIFYTWMWKNPRFKGRLNLISLVNDEINNLLKNIFRENEWNVFEI